MAVEILVKAATGAPHLLGDCPYVHKVLLALEEKKIPYKVQLINLDAKPQWLWELNPEGKVPVIKLDDKWIAESDVILGVLEEKYPNPPLSAPPEIASLGSNLWPRFYNFLMSKDPSDGSEQALLDELKALDEHLKNKGPYVNGENICAVDLRLTPFLYQIDLVLGHFKGWVVPENLTHLHHYKKLLFSREPFKKTKAADEHFIAYWSRRVNA